MDIAQLDYLVISSFDKNGVQNGEVALKNTESGWEPLEGLEVVPEGAGVVEAFGSLVESPDNIAIGIAIPPQMEGPKGSTVVSTELGAVIEDIWVLRIDFPPGTDPIDIENMIGFADYLEANTREDATPKEIQKVAKDAAKKHGPRGTAKAIERAEREAAEALTSPERVTPVGPTSPAAQAEKTRREKRQEKRQGRREERRQPIVTTEETEITLTPEGEGQGEEAPRTPLQRLAPWIGSAALLTALGWAVLKR